MADPSNPYDYLNRFKNGGAPVAKPADPLASTLDAMRDEDLRAIMREAGDPAKTADVTKLSRETGLPPALIEDRVDQVKRDLAAGKLTDVLTRDPVMAKWAAGNPRGAAAAQGDHRSLSRVGGAFQDITKGYTLSAPRAPKPTLSSYLGGIWQSLVSGSQQTEVALGQMIYDALPRPRGLVGVEYDQQQQAKRFASAQTSMELATPAFKTKTAAGLYGGVSSLAQMVPAIAATVATRNPGIGMTVSGLQTGVPAYGKYRYRGASPGMAALGASLEGGAEVIGEKLPLGVVASKFGKSTTGQFIGDFLGKEMLGEQFTTLAQDAVDTAIANPGKTWRQYWMERPDRAYETALGVFVMGGALGSLNYAATRIAEGQTARANGAAINKLGQTAQESELRRLDPEAYRSLVKHIAEAAGFADIYIPCDMFDTLARSEVYQ